MDHLTTSPDEMLKAELVRLYERRLVVDELIRCLEQYAAITPESLNPALRPGAPPLLASFLPISRGTQ